MQVSPKKIEKWLSGGPHKCKGLEKFFENNKREDVFSGPKSFQHMGESSKMRANSRCLSATSVRELTGSSINRLPSAVGNQEKL